MTRGETTNPDISSAHAREAVDFAAGRSRSDLDSDRMLNLDKRIITTGVVKARIG